MIVLLVILFGFSMLYYFFKVRKILPYLKTASEDGSFSGGKVTGVTLSLFFLNALGFWAIADVFTIPPDSISGNGNPAILLMIPLMPLFAMLVFAVALVSHHLLFRISHLVNFLILIICLVLILLCVLAEIKLVEHLIAVLGGPPSEPDSRIYRFSWFNQYTNPLYFNWTTLGMAIFITVMGSGIWAEWRRFSKRDRTA